MGPRSAPFVRASGSGPTVLCLHSTGSSSRQWSSLSRRLEKRFRVAAADLTAHGRSRGWERGEAPSLDAEVEALSPVIEAAPGSVHLVGHSYGGAVALRLALRHRERVASVSVFEPVMFRQLLAAGPGNPAGLEAVIVAEEMEAALEAGEPGRAGRLFIDYWSGAGAWDRLTPDTQDTIAARMHTVMSCFEALFADRTAQDELEALDVPTLLMSGDRSPSSGRASTQWLATILPRANWRRFPGLGHMGPVEDAPTVDAAIEGFLAAA